MFVLWIKEKGYGLRKRVALFVCKVSVFVSKEKGLFVSLYLFIYC